MTSSNIEPQNIEIDWGRFKNGKVDILIHWDIGEVKRVDEMTGDTLTYYQYEEKRMNWVLPSPMTSKVEIQSYFNDNYDQGEKILDWAKAAKLKDSDLS